MRKSKAYFLVTKSITITTLNMPLPVSSNSIDTKISRVSENSLSHGGFSVKYSSKANIGQLKQSGKKLDANCTTGIKEIISVLNS